MNTERTSGSDKIRKAVAKGIITASGVVFVASVLGNKDTSSNTSLAFQEPVVPNQPDKVLTVPSTEVPENVVVTYPQFEKEKEQAKIQETVTSITMPYARNEDPFIKAYLQNGKRPFIVSGIKIDVTESGEARQHIFMRTLTSTLPTASEVDQNMVGKGQYFPFENPTYDIIGSGVSEDKEVVSELNLGLVTISLDAQAKIRNSEMGREDSFVASSPEGQALIKEALKSGKVLRITISGSQKVSAITIA